jgi:respiratory burst oxidase
MWTPSRGSNARRSGHRRIADYLADDQTTTATTTDASDNESYTTAYGEEFFAAAAAGGGGMLPAFLADQSDLVEVMLELDEESMVVRSVTPTSAALYGAASLPAPPPAGFGPSPSPSPRHHAPSEGGGAGRLSRCSSTSSRIRRKFAWLRSPSPAPSPRLPTPAELQREAAMAARERRREQAQLNRSRAGARRALKGLRFISRTTGSVEAAELWRRVEERFNGLAREGLLSRDDFGECIGTGRRPRRHHNPHCYPHSTCELTARLLLASSRRNGGLQGVRGGHLRRAGAAAAAEPGADHQGGALRLLAPDLRSELRRAAPDLLRHVLMS